MLQYASTDVAYIAGFFDGEGCFGVGRWSNKIGMQVTIRFSQKDKAVLEWIQSLFGGSIRWGQGAYNLVLSNGAGIDLLRLMLPYLKVKKERAEYMLRIWEHKRRGEWDEAWEMWNLRSWKRGGTLLPDAKNAV